MVYPLALFSLWVFSYNTYTHPFLNWSRVLDKQVMDVAMVLKQNHITRVYNDSREFDYSLLAPNKYSTTNGLKENATGIVWGKQFHTDKAGRRKNKATQFYLMNREMSHLF